MTNHLSLIERIDDLYRAVVTSPEGWSEQSFAEWASEIGLDPPAKDVMRHVRRALRSAQKLARSGHQVDAIDEADWEGRVDSVLGAQAWRPTLDIGRIGLEVSPSPELFDDVRRRFRLVHSELWLAGVDYEEWAAGRP
ncbi:MAG TPA: hypothetical protein VGC47_06830 [Acidimicrobiia bacterium]